MKRFFYATLLLGASAFAFSSCNNGLYDADVDSTNNGSNPLNNGSGGTGGGSFDFNGTDPMSAKVEGTALVYTSASAVSINSMTQVSGVGASDNSSMIIVFPENTVVGTYDLNKNQTGTTVGVYGMGSTIYGAGQGTSGKLQIIETDATHVKGKFYFTGKDAFGAGGTKNITEGYFNVPK